MSHVTLAQTEINAETARIQKIIADANAESQVAKRPTQAATQKMTKAQVQTAIVQAKEAANRLPDIKKRITQAKRELHQYETRMANIKARDARQLLKEQFDYPVFLYDTQHVGITATGEQDTCELYPSEMLGLPAGMKAEDTAVEQFRRFHNDPDAFAAAVVKADGAK